MKLSKRNQIDETKLASSNRRNETDEIKLVSYAFFKLTFEKMLAHNIKPALGQGGA